jgi:hypothetical protein
MFRDMHVDHIEPNAGAPQIAPLLTVWRSRADAARRAYGESERLRGFAPNLAALKASGEGGYHASYGRVIAAQSGVERLSSRVGERFRRPPQRAQSVCTARLLWIRATAEGTETVAQMDCVRAEGPTDLQGYLFSPPILASQLNKRIDGTSQAGESAAA